MTLATAILCAVILQRLGELVLANYNTRKLLARGAIEINPGHYPFLVMVHVAWFVALWTWGRDQPVNLPAIGFFVILQCFRVWILATLGTRWTTRIIVLSGAPLITTGPYRYITHPNYAVVALEIAVLPLALGLPMICLIFTILNAIVLFVRIRAENNALGIRPVSHTQS